MTKVLYAQLETSTVLKLTKDRPSYKTCGCLPLSGNVTELTLRSRMRLTLRSRMRGSLAFRQSQGGCLVPRHHECFRLVMLFSWNCFKHILNIFNVFTEWLLDFTLFCVRVSVICHFLDFYFVSFILLWWAFSQERMNELRDVGGPWYLLSLLCATVRGHWKPLPFWDIVIHVSFTFC